MAKGSNEELFALLNASNIYANMFDVTRIVDVSACKILDLRDGKLAETPLKCTDVFGREERCKNCISMRALFMDEQVVKLEYTEDAVYLIISSPTFIGGRRLVVELVKDITKSLMVENKDKSRSEDMSVIIDKFNTLAATDQLTGLKNRRYIDEKMPNIINASKMLGKPVSVAMLDVDFFKDVNDKWGHQAGDHVLEELARVLMTCVRRESDFVARYGGEEFLLCFPGMPQEMCRDVCEKLRSDVGRMTIVCGDEPVHITVSIGMASSIELGEQENGRMKDVAEKEAGRLIQLADRRLYEAKNSGRNRVV